MALVPVNDLNRLKASARRFASGFTHGQKAVTVAAVIGVILVGAIFMSLSGKPTYAILFSNLQPSDAGAITQKLATDHVQYQLQDGGGTILVPQNDVDAERLSVAQAGLPSQSSSSSGLSILDKEGITTSQLTQQADYLQAIQSELESTINSIHGVTSSVVTVAMPANQTFALGSSNPTGASVLVNLQPGTTLTYPEVQAISSLTASSVPGLQVSDVTVADSNGNLLAGPGVSANGEQTSVEAAYDAATQSKVVAYLAGVLGPNNADVQVNASLNFDQIKTETQSLVSGTNGKPITACTSTQKSTTKYAGAGSPPGSTLSNTSSSSNGNYTQTQSQSTCEASTQNQTTVNSPGAVTTQSVAVLVNKKSIPAGLSLASLKSGVAAAAGIQATRGDVLSFSATNFSPAANPATAVTTPKASMLTTALKPGLAFLLVLIVLFMLWRTSRKSKKQAVAVDTAFDSLGLDPYGITAGDPITAEIPAISAATPSQLSNIQEIVDGQPEEVATVLRSWLQATS
jgi:flagellar M-ring protein FliF